MRAWLLGFCAVAMLAAAVLTWKASENVNDAARDLIEGAREIRQRLNHMLTSSWVDMGGITRTVTSNQKDSESWEDFVDRHDAEVNTAKTKWP